MLQSWVLKSKGDESSFGGNTGYADVPAEYYVYDTNVKNHDKLNVGDTVVIAGKELILGYAKITSIDVKKGVSKERFRCPVCDIQELYSRKNITPKFKCRNKHEFDNPTVQQIIVDEFTASYGSTFIAAKSNNSVSLLNSYYLKRNLYYSIQRIDQKFIENVAKKLFESNPSPILPENVLPIILTAFPKYIPTHNDDRYFNFTRKPIRIGQQKFKADLIKIYGYLCMITGCTVSETIEASHICHYRGKNDNNPYNGLLLRTDLHKLFDSDLIGINPKNLEIKLHPNLLNSYYQKYDGLKIRTNRVDFFPSLQALEYRWEVFNRKSAVPNLQN